MWAVIVSDGAIKPEDIAGQLRDEQWVPIAVTKPRQPDPTTGERPSTVLVFRTNKEARKFAQKNYPQDWYVSVVELVVDNFEWIEKKGWKVEVQPYPKLMNSHPDYELTYEVLEFPSRPDLIVRGGQLH